MKRSARLVTFVGAVLLVHSPTHGQDGWKPPRGQKCDQALSKFRPPSVGEALDSAAARQAIAAHAASGRAPERTYATVEYDKTGAVERVRFDDDLPKTDALAFGRILSAHLKPQPAQKKDFAFTLVIDAGPAPRFEVIPTTVTCPPVLDNTLFVQTLFDQEAGRLRDARILPAGTTRQVSVRMIIDPSGSPESVHIVRGSGSADIDRAALQITRAMEFLPALVARSPVRVEVTQPIVFHGGAR